MKPFLPLLIICIVAFPDVTAAQSTAKERVAFFEDTSVLNVDIITNTRKLFGPNRKKGLTIPAEIIADPTSETAVHEKALLQVRGKSRREYCYVPPLKLIFTDSAAPTRFPFKSVKLVNECFESSIYKQYLLKEYLVYKIYNLICDQSFRVRLLTVNFKDSSGRKKTAKTYGFLLEDVKDVAKRNNCREWKKVKLRPEATQRKQMTVVAIFQYMIGNTDWGVSENHNTNLIQYRDDTMSRPMVVPYDFDNSGIVNTRYALPDERLGIENVTQRLYRGFPRAMEELTEVLAIFKEKKEKIFAMIRDFSLLDTFSKREMINYLEEFYQIIDKPESVKYEFITNARSH